jgi:hypothetical protein
MCTSTMVYLRSALILLARTHSRMGRPMTSLASRQQMVPWYAAETLMSTALTHVESRRQTDPVEFVPMRVQLCAFSSLGHPLGKSESRLGPRASSQCRSKQHLLWCCVGLSLHSDARFSLDSPSLAPCVRAFLCVVGSQLLSGA